MTWQESDIQTNGVTLHVYRTGGDKPPIVLLHGATDNGLCWPRVADALSPGYALLAVDARGHGKSDKPQSGYSRDDHAGDVAGLIQALELDRPVVIGHSMGANNAAALAAHHPHLVSAVVLEDPPWRVTTEDFDVGEFAARSQSSILERKKMTVQQLVELGKTENPSWAELEFEPWAAAKRQVSPIISSGITLANFSWRGVADRITCPTLVITADTELGAMVTAETAAEIALANPRVRVARIPGAGHNIRREQFDAYMDELSTFLALVYPA